MQRDQVLVCSMSADVHVAQHRRHKLSFAVTAAAAAALTAQALAGERMTSEQSE